MIGYFDTSALLPLVVSGPSSGRCLDLWSACDQRVASMLVIAEGHAALSQARRLGRLTVEQYRDACALLDDRISGIDLVVAARHIVDTAAHLTRDYPLSGYDAVHAATALEWIDEEIVVISGDVDLLTACQAMGLAIAAA